MDSPNGLLIETLVNGPFQENAYLVAEAATRKGILIDPGSEEQRLMARIRELGVEVTEIVCTHAHIDHAGAVAPLKRLLGVPFAMHAGDEPALQFLPRQAAVFGLPDVEVPVLDRPLADGDVVTVGSLSATVLHTPGHSPGGACLFIASAGVLFSGDTLFAGSVGRTDLPGGGTQTLLRSIHDKLLTLEDAVRVFPGHGPDTTIGDERADNPFLQPGGHRFL